MVIQIGNENINIIFRQKKIKRTYIRITNKKEILVSSPKKLSESDILKLIDDHYSWLENKISKVTIITIGDDEFLLLGKMYKLSTSKNNYISIIDGIIYAKNKQQIEEYAMNLITLNFNKIIKDLSFPFLPIINFRKMRSRWGACHFKINKIVLNKILIHLPWRLIEYVIYHELAHFKIPNHSNAFYQELTRLCPNHKIYKSQLLEYSSLL